MKKFNKKFAIFTLLIMLCNFFVCGFMPIVQAETIPLLKILDDIGENISGISDNLVLAKKDVNFNTDNGYTSAVLSIEDENKKFNSQYLDVKSELSNLSFSSLVNKADDTDLTSKYQNYINLGNSDFVIDLGNIETITYDGDPSTTEIESETLITDLDLRNYIFINYLLDLIINTTSRNNNFSIYIADYEEAYDTYITNVIDEVNEDIDEHYTIVSQFLFEEESLGNVPNLMVGNKTIYEIITSSKESVADNAKIVKKGEISSKTLIVNGILSSLNGNMDKFWTNNGNYKDIELDNEISTLTDEYSDLYDDINSFYLNYSLNLDEVNYVSLVEFVNGDFFNLYAAGIELEDDYNKLMDKIDSYLSRKPSDTSTINGLLTDLNSKYGKINKTRLINDLENIVSSANLTNEDVVDKIYSIINFGVSSATKKKLIDAKNSFYELKFTDDNFKIKDDYIILYNYKDLLINLRSKVDYDFEYKLVLDNSVNKFELYDRNDWLIKTYTVVLAGDLNGDELYDDLDLNRLQKMIATKKYTDEELLVGDINQDGIINIKDLSLLKSFIDNSQIVSQGTKASFRIVKSEEGKLVKYKVYLNSDGVVNSLSYNIKASNDLKFKRIITSNNIISNNKTNPTLFVGYGEFDNNDLLMTLVYERNDVKEEYTIFEIINGASSFDNNNYVNNLISKDVIKNEIEVIVDDTVEQNNNNVVNQGDVQVVDVTKVDEVEKEPENKVVSVDDITDDNHIDWKGIIKIVIVVVLGALIIYFLNKDEEEVPFDEKRDLSKK